MTAGAALARHMDSRTEVVARALGDGTSVAIVASVSGPGYVVEHRKPDAVATVVETPHPDVAEAVYESFDGVGRGWHAAYLPRGAPPPGHAALAATVHAAGSTVVDCVAGFLDGRGEGLREGSLRTSFDEPSEEFQWDASFVSDRTGTAFKAAGRKVPGGVVMTWWV